MAPTEELIEAARIAALASECAKSRRGVVIFRDDNGALFRGKIIGRGANAQPAPFHCNNTDACREACGKLCFHAETDAIRDALVTRAAALARAGHCDDDIVRSGILHKAVLLHVKVDEVGRVVAGGGPSCWQCSREILAAGIAGVWLYEVSPNDFSLNTHCPTERVPFAECVYCMNEACGTHNRSPCGCAMDERHLGVPDAPTEKWVYYGAAEFHRETLKHPRNRLPITYDTRTRL